MPKPKIIKCISMFSGCGGLDLGMLGGFTFLNKSYPKNNIDIIWSNEINHAACQTYRRNISPKILEGDIQQLFDKMPKKADLIIGGFPCQDVSINGKMEGIKGKRTSLYIWMVKAIKEVHPKMFIAENVKGLLMDRNKESLAKILSDFKGLGYDVSYHLYNTMLYGVPETRERVIIVGTLPGVPHFEIPSETTLTPITAKQALNDLEQLPKDPVINHIWSHAAIHGDQGNRHLKADRPGYTMRSECHGNIQWHYSLPRRISMREAARIQSFPDDFIFEGGIREIERQIGNAVPPVFAWELAQSIKKCFSFRGTKK